MKKILHIRLNIDKDFSPKAKFIFDNILKTLNLKAKYYTEDTLADIDIYYGVKTFDNYPIKIHRDIITSLEFHKKVQYEAENIDYVNYKNDYIPFLFSLKGNIFLISENSVYIRKDLISSAFYLSSGWEEFIGVKEQDKLAVQEKFYFLPLIEIYADIIKTAMMQTTLRQIFVTQPQTDRFYNISLIFNKNLSHSKDNNEFSVKYTEIQKIEHYRRKFLGNNKKYYYSLITNDDTYSNIFRNIIKSKNDFVICETRECLKNSPKNFFLYGNENDGDFHEIYNSISPKSIAIMYYFNFLPGYRTLFSYPHSPFDFINNKPYDFKIIPFALFSGFFVDSCEKNKKLLAYEIENFINCQIKYNANVFIALDIMNLYYKCPKNILLFKKMKKCVKKLRKTKIKPITIDKIL